jgi:cytoskeletal protein RodZ
MIRVGDRLKKERVAQGLTIEQVAKGTKIRPSFLAAIERGDYTKLPSSAYIQGFVKNYAEFLGLPKREYAALFRREFDEKEHVRVLPEGFGTTDMPMRRFTLSPTVIFIVFIFLVLLGYAGFQYRYAIINPPLTIETPKENATVQQSVTVTGKTDHNAVVTVNDSPTIVDNGGNFSKKVSLFTGKTVITVKAQNRFGNQTQVERHVTVKE